MTQNEYETISAVIASRRKAGDDYGHIRADLEATRAAPFAPEEWAKLRFLAALDVAFGSVPNPSPVSPRQARAELQGKTQKNATIHIHADSSGEYSVTVEKGADQ